MPLPGGNPGLDHVNISDSPGIVAEFNAGAAGREHQRQGVVSPTAGIAELENGVDIGRVVALEPTGHSPVGGEKVEFITRNHPLDSRCSGGTVFRKSQTLRIWWRERGWTSGNECEPARALDVHGPMATIPRAVRRV